MHRRGEDEEVGPPKPANRRVHLPEGVGARVAAHEGVARGVMDAEASTRYPSTASSMSASSLAAPRKETASG
jgi:hypothetical protein